jgi:histidinol-phosphatase (PHP family)
MIDCHTHSIFSSDGYETLDKIIENAIDKGLQYIAITDHLDRDYLFCNKKVRQLDVDKYYKALVEVKQKYEGKIKIGVGIEAGYSKEAERLNKEIINKYDFDIVINSIHTVDGEDAYFGAYFDNKDKNKAYTRYLEMVLQSLNADYKFNVIAHLGYVSRNAPYKDKYFNYSEFKDYIDMILKTIIEKGVALEVNTNVGNALSETLPNYEILKRYKELKGEIINFGSDAHKIIRICDKYDMVVQNLKDIGFKYLTYYINKIPQQFKIF